MELLGYLDQRIGTYRGGEGYDKVTESPQTVIGRMLLLICMECMLSMHV